MPSLMNLPTGRRSSHVHLYSIYEGKETLDHVFFFVGNGQNLKLEMLQTSLENTGLNCMGPTSASIDQNQQISGYHSCDMDFHRFQMKRIEVIVWRTVACKDQLK